MSGKYYHHRSLNLITFLPAKSSRGNMTTKCSVTYGRSFFWQFHSEYELTLGSWFLYQHYIADIASLYHKIDTNQLSLMFFSCWFRLMLLCLCFRASRFCKESKRQLPGHRRVSVCLLLLRCAVAFSPSICPGFVCSFSLSSFCCPRSLACVKLVVSPWCCSEGPARF